MEYLFEVALTDDERGRRKEAGSLYKSAIEFALEAVSIKIPTDHIIHMLANCTCIYPLSIAKEDTRPSREGQTARAHNASS